MRIRFSSSILAAVDAKMASEEIQAMISAKTEEQVKTLAIEFGKKAESFYITQDLGLDW